MDLTLIAQGSTKWERFIRHWGVSYLLDEDVLFDTFGNAGVFWRNIKSMGVDISRIKHIVISHDDWDHIGGLSLLLKKNGDVRIYLCKNSSRELKHLVIRSSGKLIEVDGPLEITENIYSLGQMKADTKHGVVHEQALAVKTGKGIAVITGCAHPGIIEIVKRTAEYFGQIPCAAIGGFHMKDNSSGANENIVSELKSLGVAMVMPSHCTSAAAVKVFRSFFGKNCIDIASPHKVKIV
jgi:7,8-dihydropterin-6-yl-methyl-4-(beta-D-ribofuranosyl)aminobenzene 5'-phosphate synthase